VRIAVVGAGAIGRRHAALVQAHPQLQLAALVDPSVPGAGAAFGVAQPVSLEALLEEDRPDGVILATPNALHLSQALACLAAGVPALIEKPLADSAAAAAVLARAAAGSVVPLLVGHHRRHSAALQGARAFITSGALGRISTVSAEALFHKADDYFDATWRRQAGAGPLLINGVHEIDALRFLCGEIVAVQAMASSAVRGFEVEDTAVVNLRFADGALGSLRVCDCAAAPRSWEQTAGEDAAYPCHGDQDNLFISGTHGSLALPTLRWWRYADQRSWHLPFEQGRLTHDARDPLRAQLDHFIDVIAGRAKPLATVADAARNLDVLAAIQAAVHDGDTHHIPARAG
jgi:predicted dehydrogenase